MEYWTRIRVFYVTVTSLMLLGTIVNLAPTEASQITNADRWALFVVGIGWLLMAVLRPQFNVTQGRDPNDLYSRIFDENPDSPYEDSPLPWGTHYSEWIMIACMAVAALIAWSGL